MKAFIISNGDMKDYNFYTELLEKEKYKYIICADGGAKHLKQLEVIPDCIIGDLDSISLEDLNSYKKQDVLIKKFNKEKDYTDTQLALEFATTLPVTDIVLLGAIGSRMDHTLGNIYFLERALKNGFKACMVNENNIIYLINQQIELQGTKDIIVSLLPLTDRVEGVSTEGLYYALKDSLLEKSDPIGVSNKCIDKTIKISIKSGLLIVILARD